MKYKFKPKIPIIKYAVIKAIGNAINISPIFWNQNTSFDFKNFSLVIFFFRSFSRNTISKDKRIKIASIPIRKAIIKSNGNPNCSLYEKGCNSL